MSTMPEVPEGAKFRIIDFLIFVGLFLLSIVVGGIFAYRDRRKQSLENYYFGGRKIGPIPVALSISVSFISAITVIGGPAEVYLYGNVYGWLPLSLLLPSAFGIIYYIPLIHRLRISSSYEYLELRYHRNIRLVASSLGIMNTTAYLAIAVFLPSLALNAVTPLKLNWTIALTSAICTLYTALGGMKGVIWTDVLQSGIMLAGMAATFTQTALKVGGMDSIFSAAQRGGRDNFLTFNIDPRIRRSAVTIFFGGAGSFLFNIFCNQIFVQRYLSCKTIRTARMSVYLSAIPLALFYIFSIGNGLAMFAYYEGCDPQLSGKISKADQIIPSLAVDIFYDTPGMAGLFVSAAFCGTLSTVSSGLNAVSALSLMDLILRFFPKLKSSTAKLLISKALTVIFGVIVMALAYIMSFSSSNTVQMGQAIAGYFAGPLSGVYIMGILMPWINSKGAVGGLVCGFAFSAWVGVSAMFSTFIHDGSKRLPVSNGSCKIFSTNNGTTLNIYTSTTHAVTTRLQETAQDFGVLERTIYAISPYLYGPMGLLACIIGAHLTCLISGFAKPAEADPRLFAPLVDNRNLPPRIRQFFRFGVPTVINSVHTTQEAEGQAINLMDMQRKE